MREVSRYFTSIVTVLGIGAVLLLAPQVRAGGGQYEVVNFGVEQPVNGKSATLEVIVHDIHSNPYGKIVGEEFQFVAHHDLNGASCEMVQKISDSEGRIKAFCRADVAGRFVFEIQPVTKNRIQNGVTYAIFFTEPVATPTPATPAPTPVAVPVTPRPVPIETVQPTPQATLRPTTRPTPTPEIVRLSPSPVISPSSTPTMKSVSTAEVVPGREMPVNVFHSLWLRAQRFFGRLF